MFSLGHVLARCWYVLICLSSHDFFTQVEPLHQARPQNRIIVEGSPLRVPVLELLKLFQAHLAEAHPGLDHAIFSHHVVITPHIDPSIHKRYHLCPPSFGMESKVRKGQQLLQAF